jgi:hypothetical protein
VACLDGNPFYTCCNVVSRENSQAEEPTPCKDERLQQSLELLKTALPNDFSWPHREGLARALYYGGRKWLTNTKVDVTMHLAKRIRRWIVVRLGAVIDQRGIKEKHLWTIANHIVSTLTWHEKKAAAQARAANQPLPSMPSYVRPANIAALLGTSVKGLPPLEQGTKDHIWRLFNETLLAKIGGALPLCPSNFGRRADDKKYGTFSAFPHGAG